MVVQDALSDVGSTFQRYSQKASKLIGNKRSQPDYSQSSDDYEPEQPDQLSVESMNSDDEQRSDKPSSKDATEGQAASVSRTS